MPNAAAMRDASAWRGAELAGTEGCSHRLDAAEVEELAAALRGVRARGLATTDITRADFPLPGLAPRLRALVGEARTGRGLFLLTGLPPERFDEEDRETVFWGIGTHLGCPVS